MQFHLYLPQMRLSPEQLVERARAAEAAGFEGIAGMDHLAPPMAERLPMFEAMTTNTWLAARTSTLVVGSLVLCDTFRHPAVLARQAVTLDHLSGGRFELGLGWGSVVGEIETFGIGSGAAADRVARLEETLEVIKALWTGEAVDYDGEHHQLRGAQQMPTPSRPIPIVIGGVGRKTMKLVAEHAHWWNLNTTVLDRLDEMRQHAGDARVSIQQVIAFVPSEDLRADVTEMAQRRFGVMNPVVGDAAELADHFGRLEDRGVERVYAWFTDFASPDTIAAFGESQIDL
ncbi:MAG TPA: LLM class flavin-dependent oxidoreductase [Acidimicrobiales bacterium]|nr:LLM class flavin-dependent oxidoreductase [Acidimicrobiales bacterium]